MTALDFASNAAVRPTWRWWVFVALSVVVLAGLPLVTDVSLQLQLSLIFLLSLLALSMSFMWGYGGMLSFGQTVFYGLGGYCYAIASMNFGTTGWAMLIAVLLPAAVAALLGYFMIYGRLSDIYLSVITLAVCGSNMAA